LLGVGGWPQFRRGLGFAFARGAPCSARTGERGLHRFCSRRTPSSPHKIIRHSHILNPPARRTRVPFHPQESPFNPEFQPFPEFRLGYRHPHAIIPHVTRKHPRHSRVPPAVRSLADPNGHLYPFCFQYSCHLSFPSLLNGKPPIPFPFIPLRTLSVPTDGYTPLPEFYFPLRWPQCALRAHKLRVFAH
jgi:hypothetical protein